MSSPLRVGLLLGLTTLLTLDSSWTMLSTPQGPRVSSSVDPVAPLVDESLRLRLLSVVFQNVSISTSNEPVKPVHFLGLPDAFEGERAYRVVGHVIDETERCMASDVLAPSEEEHLSDTRIVRFKVYPWPGSADFLVAVQYEFSGANPPGACPSAARVFRVADSEVVDAYTFEPTHHTSVQALFLTDLSGDNIPELAIQSDYGGAGDFVSQLVVFPLDRNLRPSVEVHAYVRSQIDTQDEEYELILDVDKSRRSDAEQLCFTRTDYRINGVTLTSPEVTYPCYPSETRQVP